jgi:serine/threonine protein phosphatase PrpC
MWILQAPAALEAAFNQCHQQLLQLQPQQHPAANNGPGSTLDTATSGASALLLALDQNQSKLLVASAGLCKAVLARSSPAGSLTVMELTPRLALGHDPTETARLDAAGSSICYQPPAAEGEGEGSSTDAGNASSDAAADACQTNAYSSSHDSTGTSSILDDQPAAVLVAPDGSVLQHVGASRLLGCSAATSAGVVSTPVVTSWRLNGSESFVVLGSPGLWQAMNPAEVVDYVAAALASGIASSSSTGATSAAAKGSQAAAVSVGDLLTLEAQERLKLRLMDKLFGLCPGPAAPGAAGCVPGVSAVVLLLPGSPARHADAVDQQKVKQELAGISRWASHTASGFAGGGRNGVGLLCV